MMGRPRCCRDFILNNLLELNRAKPPSQETGGVSIRIRKRLRRRMRRLDNLQLPRERERRKNETTLRRIVFRFLIFAFSLQHPRTNSQYFPKPFRERAWLYA